MYRKTSMIIIGLVLVATAAIGYSKQTLVAENTSAWPPNVPFVYSMGMQKFQQNCTPCHGKWGDGTNQGPPLMHPFYKPSHHADAMFYRAALKGVQAHHWKFGNMPPVKGITRKDLDIIIPYIRWLQKTKGIY